ncbi:MAG: ribonuclease E inhibitor RraB [Leptospirales bacterium]
MGAEKRIFLNDLIEMFDNMSNQTGWNMTGPMLWGFFFSNKEEKPLVKVKERLESLGYKFIGIHPSSKEENKEPDFYWLQMIKEEAHTPDSLDARNNELYAIANELEIDSYDGADVGPPAGEPIPDDQIPNFPEPNVE